MADLTKNDIFEAMSEALSRSGLAGNAARNAGNRGGYGAQGNKQFDTASKGFVDGLKNTAAGVAKSSNALAGSLSKVDKDLSKIHQSATRASDSFMHTAKNSGKLAAGFTALVAIVGTMADVIGNSIDSYREMANVGQSFSGSMLKMQIAAAEAALPLEEFAELIKKNNQVVAIMGQQTFAGIGKTLRQSMHQFGMLGLTTENLNEYLGEYMETQRLYGSLQNVNSAQAVDSMRDLATQTTKMSELTGKNRLEVMRQTQQAMRDDSIKSKMMLLSADQQAKFGKQLQTATVYLAGMPGTAGETLTRMLTETVGRGSAMLSSDMQGFVEAGMFGVTDLMDGLRRKIEAGTLGEQDMEAFRDSFMKQSAQGMSTLKFLADTGNESAKKSINLIAEMKSLDGKKLKELQEQQKATKFFMNLGDNVKMLSGWIRERFYKSFEKVMIGFERFQNSGALKKLGDKFGAVIDNMASWLDKFIASGQLEKFGEGLAWVFDKAAGMVLWSVEAFTNLTNRLQSLGEMYDKYEKAVGNSTTALIGLGVGVTGIVAGFLALKGFLGRMAGLMAEKFLISEPKTENIGDMLRRFERNGALKVYVVNNGGSEAHDAPDGDRNERKRGDRQERRERRNRRMGRIRDNAKPHKRALNGIKGAGRAVVRGVSRVGRAALTGAKAVVRSPITRSLAGGAMKGAAGLAMAYGGNMLADKLLPGTGNSLAKLGVGIASGAATGAMFAGPLGAAVGGVIGGAMELISNWDGIKDDATKMYSSAIDALSSGMSWTSDMVSSAWTGLSGAVTSMTAKVSDSFTSFSKDITSAWNSFIGYDWASVWTSVEQQFNDAKATITNTASLAGGWMSDTFGKPMDLAIKAGGAVANSVKSMVSPSAPSSDKVANVDTEALQNQVKTLQDNYQALVTENAALRKQVDKLTEIMAENNAILRGGFSESIQQTRKGNRNLGNIAGNLT